MRLKVLYLGRIVQHYVIENDFMYVLPLLILKIVLIIQN